MMGWAFCYPLCFLLPTALQHNTGYANKDQVSGVFVDFIREVLHEAGYEALLRLVPKARLEIMFENGSADLMLAATIRQAETSPATSFPWLKAARCSFRWSRHAPP